MDSKAPHKYEYQIDPESDSAGARVLGLVGRNKTVLELGAGPGSMTRHLVTGLGCDVVAIESDRSALESLSRMARSVHELDLNSADWDIEIAKREGRFDAVIAADVLEHLVNPRAVLGKMKNLLNDSGAIVLSLPHVGHSAIAACLMDEDFDYRDWGLLDRTHIRFFGLKNIEALHAEEGLAIEEAFFVVRTPEMTEFCQRWRRLPKSVRRVLGRNRFGNVYQVVTRAVPRARARRSIRLLELPVMAPAAEIGKYWEDLMSSMPAPEGSDPTSTIADAPRNPGLFARLWRGHRTSG